VEKEMRDKRRMNETIMLCNAENIFTDTAMFFRENRYNKKHGSFNVVLIANPLILWLG